jgi:predicted ATPase/DNA-binding CsgD family transcriptional regulator
MARALLLEDAVPLLTLTGPGGVGKTRLALAIAGEALPSFADGVAWVDLAPLADPALVAPTVAGALGLTPAPGAAPAEELVRHLRPRQALLLLDNCEHLLAETADLVGYLLARCPALQVLSTSRAPLRLYGEQLFPVEPLPLPAASARAPEVIAANAAVRLFAERAKAVRPGFALTAANAATVAALCRRLDGLPLAIELAAARIAILSPEAMLAQMTDRLRLLRGGPRDLPARQRTMRDTIAWSYDLLEPPARSFFRRLSVFSGGFTAEAARAVAVPSADASAALTLLESLVEQNLARRGDDGDEDRFATLETVRAFGLERLVDHGEEGATRDRHAAAYLATAEAVDAGDDLRRAVEWVVRERPNLRAAAEHLERAPSPGPLLALAGAVLEPWILLGDALEARGWLERGLARGGDVPPRARAWALASLAGVLFQLGGEAAAALARGEQALGLCEDGDWRTRARAALWCGLSALHLGQAERSEAFFRLAQEAERRRPRPQPRAIAHLDNLQGMAALAQGEVDRAERLFAAARDREREREAELGPYPFVAFPLIGLGHAARCRGDATRALASYREGLAVAAQVRDVRALAPGLAGVAGSLAALGRWRDAAPLFGAVEALCERAGMSFAEHALEYQRAAGLPEPWQRAGEPLGWLARLRERCRDGAAADPPPLPDAELAAALWAAGRARPIDDAVAVALAAAPGGAPAVLAASRRSHGRALPEHGVDLTSREQEVLGLLCRRRTDAEIAARLCISPRTASNHVGNVIGKLGAANRREAVALAVRLGLVEVPAVGRKNRVVPE